MIVEVGKLYRSCKFGIIEITDIGEEDIYYKNIAVDVLGNRSEWGFPKNESGIRIEREATVEDIEEYMDLARANIVSLYNEVDKQRTSMRDLYAARDRLES